VGVQQLAAHHSKRNWHEPESFVPERWLENAPAEFKKDDKSAMQAFSIGPRNCLGKNLAYIEMRMILARMIWNFEMELMPESTSWKDQKTFILWEKHPLMVKLSLREGISAL
jgi:cytochrome P450